MNNLAIPEQVSAPAPVPSGEVTIALQAAPAEVIADAQKAAAALRDVIARKPKPVKINGEQYLEFEDWQTIGRFYGITAKVVSTSLISIDGVRGYEARAVAIDAAGREVTAAEAMCLSDEKNWKDKPLFTLRSMAQTRAAAKVLRNVLSWVAVLAGYRPAALDDADEALRPPKPIDYVKHLRSALLNHCNQDKRGAVECLKTLTGKTILEDVSQDEARAAIERFETEFLGAEPLFE